MLPAGTVTFLFTDIEGSTARWESDTSGMRKALALHNEALDRVFAEFDGSVFKTLGDAFCVAFRSAENAASAALAAQAALSREEAALKVRIGLHTASIEPTGNDYFGPPLNRVARIMAAANGGQILVSETTKALLPQSFPTQDLGSHVLRDLLEPAHLWQLGAGDFPQVRGLAAVRNNLPVQTTSFLGREEEMAEMERLFEKSRLLTLTGTGGTGKSRLSLQYAANRLERYPDGVWFCELAALSEREDILRLIVGAMGAPEVIGTLRDRLVMFLAGKRSLVILDNCEHLLDAACSVAEDLLVSCPGLSLLVTSREPLGTRGEAVYRVPSLSVPDPVRKPTLVDLERFSSTALFLDRLSIAAPSYHVEADEAPTIAKICGRLDGIPLAIELAAARGRAMSLEQIEKRLDDRFRLLTGGSRNALSRQQTLKALIDWSVNLLSKKESEFFVSLAVFWGGWTMEAAERVCAGYEGAEVEEFEVLDLLAALVDKSLVVFEKSTDRYRMLESVRQYALDRLEQRPDLVLLRDRHAAFFLAMAEGLSFRARGKIPDYRGFALDYENFRSAIEWEGGKTDSAVQTVLALADAWPGFHSLGAPDDYIRLMAPLLERTRSLLTPEQLLEANLSLTIAFTLAKDPRGDQMAQEAMRHLDEIDPDQRNLWRVTIGYNLFCSGRFEETIAFIQESLKADEGSSNPRYGYFKVHYGSSLTMLGEYERALAAYRQAQEEHLARNDVRGWVANQANITLHFAIRQMYDEAVEAALMMNRRSTRETIYTAVRGVALIVFGHVAMNHGDERLASRLVGGAIGIRQASGVTSDPLDRLGEETLLNRVESSRYFQEGYEEGIRWNWEPWFQRLADLRYEDLPRPIEVPFREMIE